MNRKTENKGAKKNWISSQLCIAEASFTCNLYCEYCHNPPDGKRFSIEKIIDMISSFKPYAVSLEGRGEPLVNNDIFKIIKEIRKKGVEYISISTNGVALNDFKFASKIVKEADFLIINFPSHIKEVYNKITRSVKYDLAVRAFKNLADLNALYKVRIFHIITQKNYLYLGDFVDWIKKNNLGGISMLNFCYVRNKGRVKNNKDILPAYSSVSKAIKLALAKSKLYGFKAVIQNMPLCMIEGFEGFSFEFHRFRRGDPVFERGVELPVDVPPCRRCSLKPACCGARRDYIEVYGYSELKPSNKDPYEIKEERF